MTNAKVNERLFSATVPKFLFFSEVRRNLNGYSIVNNVSEESIAVHCIF